MNKNKLLFCHGFPFSKYFFKYLAFALKEDFEILELDLGYYGNPSLIDQDMNHAIAIGHGLGFNKLLDMDIKLQGIVGISTLLDYVRTTHLKRQLDSLKMALEYDKKNAITTLIKRSSGEIVYFESIADANWDLITKEIAYMQSTNSTKILQRKNIPAIFLHSSKDIIYPYSDILDQAKDYPVYVNNNSSHLLGYIDVVWCKNHINNFVKSIGTHEHQSIGIKIR